MGCLQDAQLQQLIAASGSAEDDVDWTEHLDACTVCQRRLEELSGEDETLVGRWSELREPVQYTQISDESKQSLYDLASHPLSSVPEVAVRFDATDSSISHLMTPGDSPGIAGHFDGYRVLDRLGQGGMGIVLQAVEPVLERVVAIKIMLPHLATDPTARARFLSEAKAVAKIEHPNVMGIHRVAEYRQTPYLVMPCVEGHSVAELIRDRGTLPAGDVIRIAIQACHALDAAHSAGIIHRDIKPANLLIDSKTETVRVSDFGLAQAATGPSLTQTGFLTGTPQFMSAEQALGKSVDHRTDLYSLGAVMYAMLCGRPPFQGEHPMSVVHQAIHAAPPKLAIVQGEGGEIPAWLSELIEVLMSKDPSARPQSASQLRECLVQQKNYSGSSSAQPQADVTAAARRSLFGSPQQLLATATLVVVLVGVWFAAQWVASSTGGGLTSSPPEVAGVVVQISGDDSQQYSTLDAALQSAPTGCTVVINTPGPHLLTESLLEKLGQPKFSVELRAGAVSATRSGELAKPVELQIATGAVWRVASGGELTLVGVRISRSMSESGSANRARPLLSVEGGNLMLRSCYAENPGVVIDALGGAQIGIEQSVLAAFGAEAMNVDMTPTSKIQVRDSLVIGQSTLRLRSHSGGEIQLRDSTFYGDRMVDSFSVMQRPARFERLRINARGNVFQHRYLHVIDSPRVGSIAAREQRGLNFLRDQMQWRGDFNLFALSHSYYGFTISEGKILPGQRGDMELDDWRQLCVAEGEASAEAATAVLKTSISASELSTSNFVLGEFGLEDDRSSAKYGADISALGPLAVTPR